MIYSFVWCATITIAIITIAIILSNPNLASNLIETTDPTRALELNTLFPLEISYYICLLSATIVLIFAAGGGFGGGGILVPVYILLLK